MKRTLMLRRAAALIAGLLPAFSAQANFSMIQVAGPGGGGGAVSCPYADQAAVDGCNSAVAASWQKSNFFTSYAPQQGQTYAGTSFQGTISGGVLTIVSGTPSPALAIGNTIVGAGIPAGVYIASGTGPYNLTNAGSTSVTNGAMHGLARPPWNVAGVDYPVGITAGTVLKDPMTLPVCSGVSAPPACISSAYNASPATHVVFIYGSNPTINGYDFSLEGGWLLCGQTGASFSGAPGSQVASGALTVTNNKFFTGTNFQYNIANMALNDAVMGQVTFSDLCSFTANSITSVDVEHNTFDLNAISTDGTSTQASQFTGSISGTTLTVTAIASGSGPLVAGQLLTDASSGAQITGTFNPPILQQLTGTAGGIGTYKLGYSFTISSETMWAFEANQTHVAFLGATPANPPNFRFNLVRNSNDRVQCYYACSASYNYWEGNHYEGDQHGEWTLFGQGENGGGGSGSGQALDVTWNYNTHLQPNTFSGGWTALIYLSSGSTGQNWRHIVTNNNTFILNSTAVNVTANSSPGTNCGSGACTVSWNFGPAYQFSSGTLMCSNGQPPASCGGATPGQLGALTSGASSNGTWTYSHVFNTAAGGTGYITNYDNHGIMFPGGINSDWTTADWTCKNNYVDDSGLLGPGFGTPNALQNVCDVYTGVTVPTLTHSGNRNMLTNTGPD